jgi:hypothetical protein
VEGNKSLLKLKPMIKTTKIKIGEIFEVEGKMYIVAKPKTSSDLEINDHCQIVIPLIEIQ